MKTVYIIFAFSVSLFGFAETIQSFSADFEQTIADENGKELVYKGHLWAERPNSAHWQYTEPVVKDIYVLGTEVIVIEPDMEQAIIRTLNEEIDFFTILSNTEQVDADRYKAVYNAQEFAINVSSGLPKSISFSDTFDNKVVIRFHDAVKNTVIERRLFEPEIPASFDIVR